MSIDDFLEDMAHRKSTMLAYQKNRGQFSESILKEIFISLKDHYYHVSDIDEDKLSGLIAHYTNHSLKLFDILTQFMTHYERREAFTFQIIPENEWNLNVVLPETITDFSAFLKVSASKNVTFKDEVKEFQTMCLKIKESYKAVHVLLKSKTYDFFPSIIDLPSLGLKELDFILLQEAKEYLNTFHDYAISQPSTKEA